MREWYVIENSRNRTVFGTDEIKGYIPRDVVENEMGIPHKKHMWFTREQSKAMREHPEWRTDEPK